MRRRRRRFKPRLDEEADAEEEDEFDLDTFDVMMAEVWKARMYREARRLAKKRKIETYVV